MPGGTPVLSIVIPVRNGMPFLPRALESALAVDVDDLEVVVCENFSTDGTAEWLRTVDDPRVRVLEAAEPRSAQENWTAACAAASGTWVKLLCADDFLLPGGAERQLAAARQEPGIAMVASRRRVVDERDGVILRRHGLTGLLGRRAGVAALKHAVADGSNSFGEPSAVLFSGAALAASLPFEARYPYLTDLDMYAKVLRHGDFVGLESVDAAFRVNGGSWSAEVGRGQFDEVAGWMRDADRDPELAPPAAVRGLRAVKMRLRYLARRLASVVSRRRGSAQPTS